jgi:alpha-tubulin suppressor-like RCC1 family protein
LLSNGSACERYTTATPVRLETSCAGARGESGMPRVTALACGQQHTVGVTAAGGLMSWGAAEFGQLGHGPAAGIGIDLLQPRYVAGSREMHFVSVACGMGHTLALTGSGHVYSFGQGTFGALGHGDHANRDNPARIDALWSAGVTQVAAGDNHSVALTVSGEVYTW